MAISVSLAQDEDQDKWERFRRAAKLKHHAHQWMWRTILEQTFGHKPYYFIAYEPVGEVVGIVPMFLVRSLIFGKALISVPYLNGGGIVANSEEARQALAAECQSLGESIGARYIELRERSELPVTESTWTVRSHKVAMLLPLFSDPQQMFESFPGKLRSQIRRPAKDGMHAEFSQTATDRERLLNAFYSVFTKNMRDLGTPVYPKRLFDQVMRSGSAQVRVFVVWQGNEPAAAAITIMENDVVEIPWASSLKRFSRSSPNMLLYWEAIKTACSDGAKLFDFGRCSSDSGPYRFKLQWGAIPHPLFWYYQVFSGSVPDVNPQSSKFSTLVECWKHLPLPVANTVGPWLTRSLP